MARAFDAAGCGGLLDDVARLVGLDYREMEAFNCEPGSTGGRTTSSERTRFCMQFSLEGVDAVILVVLLRCA